MLKTQATGRRLDEGKAINLSLSALGDVISALQNKRHHVPYRNSKLTQVLKDSLGSDSKTIMLTHVSSKEEDMCETLCSLGFASRVKSIHLGSEEPTEVRDKKEVLMDELLQKMKHLDTKRQDIKRETDRINRELQNLPIPDTIKENQLEDSARSTERLQTTGTKDKKIRTDHATASLPRFMRATVCSEKKTSKGHPISVTKRTRPPVPSMKKKPSSVYAESEIFRTKGGVWRSGHGSDCTISTINYSHRDNTNDWSEYSQFGSDSPEYDTKNIIFIQHADSPKNLVNPFHESVDNTEASLSDKEASVLDKTDKNKQTVRIQRHIQMTTKTTTNSNRSKRVLAIPIDKWDNKFEKQNWDYATSKAGTRNVGMGDKELNKYFKKDLSFYQTISEGTNTVKSNMNETVNESQSFLVNLSFNITEGESIQNTGTDQTCNKNKLLTEHNEVLTEISDVVVVGRDSSTVQRESPAFRDNTSSRKSPSEEFSRSEQHKKKADRSISCSMRCRRNLFMENDLPRLHQQNAALGKPRVPVTNVQEEKYSIGACQILRRTVQILWAIALLGLGNHSLGFCDDFFHGLML